MHNELKAHRDGNCLPLDDISILHSSLSHTIVVNLEDVIKVSTDNLIGDGRQFSDFIIQETKGRLIFPSREIIRICEKPEQV